MPFLPPRTTLQAEELAARLKSEGVTRILCSPFLRALHTAHVVADELDLPVCVEPGITEWLTPSLVGRDAPYEPPAVVDLAKRFPRVDTAYEPVLHPSPAAYPESEERLLERMAAVAGKLADAAYPHNVLLVSHAPCNLGEFTVVVVRVCWCLSLCLCPHRVRGALECWLADV